MADAQAEAETNEPGLWRDLVAYWILGLCNNYGYVVMLSAAHDIIAKFDQEHKAEYSSDPKVRECNFVSTGAILIADIFPALVIKVILPFLPFWVHVRILVAILLSAGGFLFVAFATSVWIALAGVVLTSLSIGIGELTFVAYTSQFNKNVISTWSSGTGGAGIIGSVSYAGLRQSGVDPKTTMLIMLAAPALEALTFWILLRHPSKSDDKVAGKRNIVQQEVPEGIKDKILYIRKVQHYMAPLGLVYFFEYFINQSLFELIYFKNIFIDHPAQYRWFQVDYQIGVFISRSSVNIYHFKYLWFFALLQGLNVIYFLSETLLFYTPTIWIVLIMIFWEGLLGGGAYVNTFYKMSYAVPPEQREFAMSVVMQADAWGITLASFLSIPVHNAICKLPAVLRN